MPSFDIVSEVEKFELTNAVDQTTRELTNRFDFRGVDFSVTQDEENVKLTATSEFQAKQMLEVFQQKLVNRGIDVGCLETGDPTASGKLVYMVVKVKQGIDTDTARKMVKMIKNGKFKVQTAIQGEKLRVTGKKRDDLQEVIAFLKSEKLGLPLQFNNFRE
ncbi:MAG: YajQ family cyclic di-GMP-binding protein [Gammaproteobacteria bacterium CG22_combo_CG10-13_8_21_14_all_40_8]|nr:MAG: YajQ family cyclic di-GMP-binding protein [Gammaproteobacteria bacterium CG22_combo_CG10-13_8_21_14_all_40_8]